VGGPRHEASERIVLRRESFVTEGWTLNVSRGGVRVIVEEPLDLGAVYELTMGAGTARPGKVVWVQDEADGQICGVEFLDWDGATPPPVAAPQPSEEG
jgi:hypothetical protein